jgi:hypothetical protein
MSEIFKIINPNNNSKENPLENTLAKSLEKLVDLISQTTEFTQNELKSYTLIKTDKHLAFLMQYYENNKKHLKRKFIAELILALKEVSSCIASVNANNNVNNQMYQQNGGKN